MIFFNSKKVNNLVETFSNRNAGCGVIMLKKSFILIYITLLLTTLTYCQQKNETKNGYSITGNVFNEETKAPIEYSNIVLLNYSDNKLVTGTITNKDGGFILKGIKPGKYNLNVQYVGYTTKKIKNILLSTSRTNLDLGKIYLKPSAINMKNVVVEGKRSPISYDLDKKVIDVSQMATAMSGTAADVLQNVPSVSVDINGNVSLRGSTNFQVLINGHPSVMDAQDALQQIPASSIKTIELITNPSAKYDASGTAGIINIVLKKNTNMGLSGLVDIMGGLRNKYGGNVIFQYKTPFINYNLGLDFNHRSFPGTRTENKQFIISGNTSYLNSNGDMTWGRTVSGIKGGLDFNLSGNDILSIGGRYGVRSFLRNSTLNYDQWYSNLPNNFYYLDNTNHNHSGTFYDFNSNYQHKFGDDGNQLTANLSFRHRNNNEASASYSTITTGQINGTKTTELGPGSELRGNLDYVLPINKNEKFSAGTEYFSRIRQDINKLYFFDSTSNTYIYQLPFSHTNDFNRTRFAAYSIFSNKWDSLGVQLGARTEYTYQLVKLAENGQQFSLSRWDFFPSIHASYNFAGGTQIMAGYSRRIERPDGGDLEPFYTWFDATDVRIGNPNLQPEFIDSYDIGYQTFFGKISFSNDFYYRFTHNKMEDINSVYAENVTLHSSANVGTDYSLGAEISVLFNPVKIWQFNLMGDVYDYKIQGNLFNQSFANESFDWNIKLSNDFTITPSTELQLNTRYHSPSVTAQGKWKGYFITDLAVKQNLMSKDLSLILQVRDLLHTGGWEFYSQGTDFYNYTHFVRESPQVMLDLKYNFNNYKEKDQSNGNGQDNNGSAGD